MEETFLQNPLFDLEKGKVSVGFLEALIAQSTKDESKNMSELSPDTERQTHSTQPIRTESPPHHRPKDSQRNVYACMDMESVSSLAPEDLQCFSPDPETPSISAVYGI